MIQSYGRYEVFFWYILFLIIGRYEKLICGLAAQAKNSFEQILRIAINYCAQ